MIDCNSNRKREGERKKSALAVVEAVASLWQVLYFTWLLHCYQ